MQVCLSLNRLWCGVPFRVSRAFQVALHFLVLSLPSLRGFREVEVDVIKMEGGGLLGKDGQ